MIPILAALLWLDLRLTRLLTWRQRRTRADIARLTKPLPPPRVSLLPPLETVRDDWPERLTPTDLAEAYVPHHAAKAEPEVPALAWTVSTAELIALIESEMEVEAT